MGVLTQSFDSIEIALNKVKQGGMVIIVDDESRENEGDLVFSGDLVCPKKINFMAKHARGLICVPLSQERSQRLGLDLMAVTTDPHSTAFTVSVDALDNITTGISAFDRCETVRVLADDSSTRLHLCQPGHMFPLIAKPGGVLQRAGHTEASVDLMRLAGLSDVAVICEVMNDDGSMARLPDLLDFKDRHGIPIITIEDLIKYRLQSDSLIEKLVVSELSTAFGTFTVHRYKDVVEQQEYTALVKGDVCEKENVLVRVHTGCMLGDVFQSLHCDCSARLTGALRVLEDEGCGVLLYVQRCEGQTVESSLPGCSLQNAEVGAVQIDQEELRLSEYGIGAQVLRDLGLSTLRMLTNNPKILRSLEGFGLTITASVPIALRSR